MERLDDKSTMEKSDIDYELIDLIESFRDETFIKVDSAGSISDRFEKIESFLELVDLSKIHDNRSQVHEAEHLLTDPEHIDTSIGNSPDASQEVIEEISFNTVEDVSENSQEIDQQDESSNLEHLEEASGGNLKNQNFQDVSCVNNGVGEAHVSFDDAYSEGFDAAKAKYKKLLIDEQQNLQQISKCLFEIHENLTLNVEQLIAEKIREVSIAFLGQQIDAFPVNFENQIRKVAMEIDAFSRDIKIELSEADYNLLTAGEYLNDNNFTLIQNSNLVRGEFEIRVQRSGYSQRIFEK